MAEAEYYEARVLFDYTPVAADELNLRRGESIAVRVGPEEEESWLYGSDQRGRHGIFPANYVADVRTATSMSAAVHVSNDTENNHGSGGGGSGGDVLSGVPYQRRGDTAVQAGGVAGTSTATSYHDQAGAAVEQNNLRGVMEAAADYVEHGEGRDGSAAAPYHSSDEKMVSAYGAGEEESAYNNGTATANYSAHYPHDENGSPTPLESMTAARSAAAVEEGGGSGHDNLPDGWLSAIDEGSGAVYYYTVDGQSSWIRPSADTVVVEPLMGSGGGDESTPIGKGDGSTRGGPNSRSLSSSVDVSSCLLNGAMVRSLAPKTLVVRAVWFNLLR